MLTQQHLVVQRLLFQNFGHVSRVARASFRARALYQRDSHALLAPLKENDDASQGPLGMWYDNTTYLSNRFQDIFHHRLTCRRRVVRSADLSSPTSPP